MIESFNKLESREKRLIILLAVIIIFYLLYTFIYQPIAGILSEVKEEIEALERREAVLKKDLSDFDALKNDYGKYNINDLLISLPDQGKVPEIIVWIEQMFSDPSLTKPNIGFSLDTSTKDRNFLQITFAFSGSYKSIYSLMENIENSSRLTTIESVNLSGTNNSLNANLVVRVYGQNFGEIPQGEFDFENISLFGGR